MIAINNTGRLAAAILGGIVGGQLISNSMDKMGLYDIYNSWWNIAIGLLILIGIARFMR